MVRQDGKLQVERQNNPADRSLTFENQITAERYFSEDINNNAHFSPGSVLIATVGTDFHGGCKDKIKAMLDYTRKCGYICRYIEFQVYHNVFPQASHASTRNSAVFEARIGGPQFICLLDTDVEPSEDMLVNLLKHNLPIVAPMTIDPDTNFLLGGPRREKDTGLFIQKWLPQCFMLIKVTLFNNPEIKFSVEEAEDMFSQRLSMYGISQYVDTSQVLTLASPPGRPDSAKFDHRMELLKERYDKEPSRHWITREQYDQAMEQDQFIAVLGTEDNNSKQLLKQKVAEFEGGKNE